MSDYKPLQFWRPGAGGAGGGRGPLVQKTFSQAVVEAFIQAAKSTACTRGQY